MRALRLVRAVRPGSAARPSPIGYAVLAAVFTVEAWLASVVVDPSARLLAAVLALIAGALWLEALHALAARWGRR